MALIIALNTGPHLNESFIRKNLLILISVLQNEYMIADRSVDDKTMHELSSFMDSDAPDISGVLDLEIANIQTFVELYLINLLEKHTVNIEADATSPDYVDRSITLASLKLFKTICNYHRDKTIAFETTVEKVLAATVSNYFLTSIISAERINNHETNERKLKRQQPNTWLTLLNKFKLIDHDLKLYWNSKGVDGLMTFDVERFSELFRELEKHGFESIIEAKLIDYLEL